MCGIYGEISGGNVLKNATRALKALEYRGYDSAGIAAFDNGKIEIEKYAGKIEVLDEKIKGKKAKGFVFENNKWMVKIKQNQISEKESNKKTSKEVNAVIAHTRWATHGEATDCNSHPFLHGKIALVHNGIIENYKQIKKELTLKGIKFKSETDTEVVCALINEELHNDDFKKKIETLHNQNLITYKTEIENNQNLTINKIASITNKLVGQFALVILNEDEPNKIMGITNGPPLIIAKFSNGKIAISSDDITFNSDDINEEEINDGEVSIYRLEPNECFELTQNKINVFENDGNEIKAKQIVFEKLNKSAIGAKGKYSTFMEKEINESAFVLKKIFNCLSRKKLNDARNAISSSNNVWLIGCGTAYHACLMGKFYFEKHLKKATKCEVASEFRYNKYLNLESNDVFIFVSQSGETADTIAAANLAKKKGGKIIVISNNKTSTLARMADLLLSVDIGKEIAVASTKNYLAQVFVFLMIANKELSFKSEKDLFWFWKSVEKLQIGSDEIKTLALKHKNSSGVFFIGRQQDAYIAKEASLKLKEVSYIFSEAYPAGELKHGSIALIDEEVLVVAIITNEDLKEKTLSALHEVKSRGAKTMVVTCFDEEKENNQIDDCILISKLEEDLMAITAMVPLQHFALEMATVKGIDADKPKNLAKAVTVE